MSFREPKSLLHGLPVPGKPMIRDAPEVAAQLAIKWDNLDLLQLRRTEIHVDSPVRIFGAFKDPTTHRQIGDRRGQNAREGKVLGPSRDLPSAADFCEVFCNAERISVTDRKDFYHQLAVSESKAIHNTIGPAIPQALLQDTKAFSHFLMRDSSNRYRRASHGDRLREEVHDSQYIGPGDSNLWASFRAILQGDHTGVEVATESHTALLQEYGLLGADSRMVASRPLGSSNLAQGLVIDDYYAVSVEPKNRPPEHSVSASCLHTAKLAYEHHGLAGSPQKDIEAASEGKVIGGYLNSGPEATSRGLVTLAAPIAKRLAICYLSLEVASLPATTDALHLCMVGAWVSILGFRRPLMSVLQHCFHLVDTMSFNRDRPQVIPLPRNVANELTILAVLMPLAMTDLSAPFSEQVYCTDASTKKGAILSAPIKAELSEVLWRAARSKGSYSRLLSPTECLLRRLGEHEELSHPGDELKPDRPLACHFEFVEVFAGAAKISSYLGSWGIAIGPPLDLSESPEYDLASVRVIEWLTFMVAEKRLLAFFLGPPCTTFSIMRRPRLRSKASPLGFDPSDPQTHIGNQLAHRSCQLMMVGSRNNSAGMLETPFSSYMKGLRAWQIIKSRSGATEVRADSCRFGSEHLKAFRLLGLNLEMRDLCRRFQCTGKHVQIEGSLTKKSATYTDELACAIARTFFGAIQRIKSEAADLKLGEVRGLECQLANEIMLTSPWKIETAWTFKKESHINILEEAVVLRLCNRLASDGKPKRVCALVDSNVVRCSTSKGRTSSFGLSPVLRRVSSICVAAGIYLSVPFTPTRLNCADDPTRDVALRQPTSGLGRMTLSKADAIKLASVPKSRRWASNWIRIVILTLGVSVLELSDRSQYRQVEGFTELFGGYQHLQKGFDNTLGYPGEGPFCSLPTTILFSLCTLGLLIAALGKARPCRWNLNTGHDCSLRPRGFVPCSPLLLPVLLLSVISHGAMAMPLAATTAGETRRAALRQHL